MGLFTGKKGLIVGVANDRSIAWGIAEKIMNEGGVCGFTHLPDDPEAKRQKNRHKVAQLTEPHGGAAKFLVPLDVQSDENIAEVMKIAESELGQIDFLLHSVAFASLDDLRVPTVECSRDGFKLAMDISAYSLIALTNAARPLMKEGGSVCAMTYFGGEKAVQGYNMMGVCKAALDSIVKYLAFDLGDSNIRVNAISAGPLKTLASSAVGAKEMLDLYSAVSPLGRNITLEEVANSGAFLLSDMSTGITGELLHVDAGYNIMGSPNRLATDYKRLKDEAAGK
ncbi:enoyl-ACP reductase [Bremerella cremea]|uniref:Enoyl-[acyl-carrier-protein] reductase [NADH] n=1 Tax=Blastopirellula marina TaxID=124 RepID=A0A2S8FPN5_9BACT|nr:MULTISPECIES: enoyl-ACP reductase [Pirellulaceae]PQO34127.1 enoyl-[acyl-carrier-protein] reductase FabI [Blastopirellula marina]RCS46624.1 enoyl-ACP reductase [Bremerella cremea]